MIHSVVSIAVGLIILALAATSNAAEFYVDPVNGSMDNDGSKANPWSTMEEVWRQNKIRTQAWISPWSESAGLIEKNASAPVQPGDTIYLMTGNHGDLSIKSAINTDWIYVKAYAGETPRFNSIYMRAGAKWVFDGLHIGWEYGSNTPTHLFSIDDSDLRGPSSDIVIRKCTLSQTSVNTASWTQAEWENISANGIYISEGGTVAKTSKVLIEENNISNVNRGILVNGNDITIKGNAIAWFISDGIRVGTSDTILVECNTIKEAVSINGVHHDCIQAYSTHDSTTISHMTNITVSKNTCINTEDDSRNFIGVLQCVGLFDGLYDGLKVENNLCVVNAYHCLGIYGARGASIANNTCAINVKGHPDVTESAGIIMGATNAGTHGSDNVVINNFASHIIDDNGGLTRSESNITGYTPTDHFQSTTTINYNLIPASTAVNTGATIGAPTIDISEHERDTNPDVGAYEYIPVGVPSIPKNFRITISTANGY